MLDETPESADSKKEEIDDRIIDIIFEINPALNKVVNSHKLAEELNDNTLKITAILLMGDPGLGKSLAAHALAKKLKANLTFIKASTLGNEFQNSASSNLERHVQSAERAEGPQVIVIDELHKLMDETKNAKRNDMDPATCLQQAMDNNRSKRILFVGTANDIKNIPAPLQSRFRNNKIQFVAPNHVARKKIVSFYADDRISKELLDHTAKQTKDMSIRDLEAIVEAAKYNAAQRHSKEISKSDLDVALKEMNDSIALEKETLLEKAERWGGNIWNNVKGPLIGITYI